MATHDAQTPRADAFRDYAGRAIEVRRLTPGDIIDALKLGLADFCVKPSHIFILGLIYPVGAGLMAAIALDLDLLPLVFPIAGGYAIGGPFAAIVLYEISRRREEGGAFEWANVADILHTASKWAIATLAFVLVAIFAVWLAVAQAIYDATVGTIGFSSIGEFIRLALTTPEGVKMIVLGNGAGFVLATAVFASNVVSFPMLLDRHVGPATAVATSLRVVAKSPIAMAFWGLIIAVLMIAGTVLLLAGLAVVLPVLGHASWHVYRKAVAR
ncbi:MAG: DUF2189 domain-containing protein [Parvularculaceae bacterium]